LISCLSHHPMYRALSDDHARLIVCLSQGAYVTSECENLGGTDLDRDVTDPDENLLGAEPIVSTIGAIHVFYTGL